MNTIVYRYLQKANIRPEKQAILLYIAEKYKDVSIVSPSMNTMIAHPILSISLSIMHHEHNFQHDPEVLVRVYNDKPEVWVTILVTELDGQDKYRKVDHHIKLDPGDPNFFQKLDEEIEIGITPRI